ncbi:type VII secretion-associated serine protease mycosin [Streptomyces sp. 8K308]|uniref:type VII secretion-associated serine protease mycosin n=1 Tax=Streptomyces sp. 8K308 TaxID=2530388 RepID=UPI001404E7D7|nr:type VII secretion-associated serine protease mycosin [Streptomyces sp. 8K308]
MSQTNRSSLRRLRWLCVGALATSLCFQGGMVPQALADDETGTWHLDALRAEEIWQHTQGAGITVAVIDSGVDDSVPELRGRVLEGTDLSPDPVGAHVDANGHGTTMASLIAGAEGGTRGLAPEATILPIRVQEGIEGTLSDEFDFGIEERLGEAIAYAVEAGAQIINISMSKSELGIEIEVLDEALAEAARQDVLIFAGAGNDGEEGGPIGLPATREGVVAVAAVDPDGGRAAYSSAGPQVVLAAPGTDLSQRCVIGSAEMCLGRGTSHATALASASAALIWSAHPDWTKNQVLRAMIETADSNGQRDEYVGYGMIDPARVIVDGEGDPGEPDVNPLFEEYEASLTPPVSPEPEVEEPEVPPREAEEGPAVAVEDEDGGGWLVAAGGGLAVVVVGVVGWAVWRSRRRQRLGTVYAGTAPPPEEGVRRRG